MRTAAKAAAAALAAILAVGAAGPMAMAKDITSGSESDVPVTATVHPTPGTLVIPQSVVILTRDKSKGTGEFSGDYVVRIEGADLGRYAKMTLSNEGLVMRDSSGEHQAAATITQPVTELSYEGEGQAFFTSGNRDVKGNISVKLPTTGSYSGTLTFTLKCEDIWET